MNDNQYICHSSEIICHAGRKGMKWGQGPYSKLGNYKYKAGINTNSVLSTAKYQLDGLNRTYQEKYGGLIKYKMADGAAAAIKQDVDGRNRTEYLKNAEKVRAINEAGYARTQRARAEAAAAKAQANGESRTDKTRAQRLKNRPRGRVQNVTGAAKPIFKKGFGLRYGKPASTFGKPSANTTEVKKKRYTK